VEINFEKGSGQLKASKPSIKKRIKSFIIITGSFGIRIRCSDSKLFKIIEILKLRKNIMKAIKIIVCLTIVVAAIAYAGATKTEFAGGVLISKGAATVGETNGWLVFAGMGEKDQVQITGTVNPNISMDGGKMIKQKGKVTGLISNLIVVATGSTAADAIADPTKLGGNEKFQVKLKGFQIGTVLAKTAKQYQVASIFGAAAGTGAKGIKIMTMDKAAGDIQGTATERVVIGGYRNETNLVPVTTMIKLIKAKGKIGYVDATLATAAKAGKTKWGAKSPSDGDVLVKSLADWAEAKKNKNVTLATNVVSGL